MEGFSALLGLSDWLGAATAGAAAATAGGRPLAGLAAAGLRAGEALPDAAAFRAIGAFRAAETLRAGEAFFEGAAALTGVDLREADAVRGIGADFLAVAMAASLNNVNRLYRLY